MSIFGTGRPKIVDASSNTILLDYAVVLVDEPQEDNLFHRSEISQYGAARVRPHNWRYVLRINLWKRDENGDTPDALDYFSQLYALLDTNVTLHRHRDYPAFKDANGDDVPFVVWSVVPGYHSIDYWATKDILTIEFRSLQPVDLIETSKQTVYVGGEEVQVGGEGIIPR